MGIESLLAGQNLDSFFQGREDRQAFDERKRKEEIRSLSGILASDKQEPGSIAQRLAGLDPSNPNLPQQVSQQDQEVQLAQVLQKANSFGESGNDAAAAQVVQEYRSQLINSGQSTDNIDSVIEQAADNENFLPQWLASRQAAGIIQGPPQVSAKDQSTIDLNNAKAAKANQEASERGIASNPLVQSADILPDGSTIQVMKSGVTQVTDPQGNILDGQARQDAIRESRQFGADFQGKRSRERTLGSEVAKTSIQLGSDAFKRMEPVRANIKRLDQVVNAIDRGAKSGVIDKMLPSISSASVELDNLQRQLGLDVVGMTTFGALSKGELDLALDTALPTSLDQPELRQWALDKRAAQVKVADELSRASKFFSMGGTIGEYVTLNQGRKAEVGGGQQRNITVDF